jgi:hypothetical protein
MIFVGPLSQSTAAKNQHEYSINNCGVAKRTPSSHVRAAGKSARKSAGLASLFAQKRFSHFAFHENAKRWNKTFEVGKSLSLSATRRPWAAGKSPMRRRNSIVKR